MLNPLLGTKFPGVPTSAADANNLLVFCIHAYQMLKIPWDDYFGTGVGVGHIGLVVGNTGNDIKPENP